MLNEEDINDLKKARELINDVWTYHTEYEKNKKKPMLNRVLTIICKLDRVIGDSETLIKTRGGSKNES